MHMFSPCWTVTRCARSQQRSSRSSAPGTRHVSRRSGTPRIWSKSVAKRWPMEAARYYPRRATPLLIELFERIRRDDLLRRFLGPRILESLYVLGEAAALPLFEALLVTGHTDRDLDRCEVTRALVAVRKLTGRV